MNIIGFYLLVCYTISEVGLYTGGIAAVWVVRALDCIVGEKFVICRLCGRHFGQITASHLDREHDTTIFKYKEMFPDADLVTDEHVRRSIPHLWDHFGRCPEPEREKRRREKISEALTGRPFTDEHCRHLAERPIGWQSTPQAREANSRGLKAWWAVPENRERRIRQIREGQDAQPNESEKVLQWYLDYLFPGKWKYNDGWFILAGKIPDFVNVDGQKKVIELFGFRHGPDYTDEAEEDKKELFAKFGYELLVVWDEEAYYGNLELFSKLREFCAI